MSLKVSFTNSSNTKSTWRVINQLLNRKKVSATPPSQFVDENRKYSDPSDIACAFDNYCGNIGTVLSQKRNHIAASPSFFFLYSTNK